MNTIPTEAPTPLASLITTQPGSVVSRVLLRTEGCTMTAFAFDEGQGLTEHTSPHTALVTMLEGELTLTMNPGEEGGGQVHRMGPGDALTIPPSVPHALHGDTAFKMLLLLVKDVPEAE